MDEASFWEIIKRAKSEADGDIDGVAGNVKKQLAELPALEIISFDYILNSKLRDAYKWKLWGAAYLMNCGCSDDGFEYFRGWLIVQGEKVFEAALVDPDSLAEIADPDAAYHECEEIFYVAPKAYEEVTGEEMPLLVRALPELSDQNWDFDDSEATRQQLPKLSRIFGE